MGSRPRLVTARFSISHSAGVAVSVKHRVCRSTELTAEREEIHKSVVLHCGSFPGNCALFLCASSRVHSKRTRKPGLGQLSTRSAVPQPAWLLPQQLVDK